MACAKQSVKGEIAVNKTALVVTEVFQHPEEQQRREWLQKAMEQYIRSRISAGLS